MQFVVLKPQKARTSAHRGPSSMAAGSAPRRFSATKEVTPDAVAEAGQSSEYGFIAMPVGLITPYEARAETDSQRRAALLEEEKKAGRTWGIRSLFPENDKLCPYDGKGIRVAILDTGIDKNHAAFRDKNLKMQCRNFLDDGKPEDDVTDENGHGTHTAATVFGRTVDGIHIGVAPGVRDVLIGKVLGEGASTLTVLRGIEWASDRGAHVILMSLGFDIVGMREEFASYGIDGNFMTPEEATWRALSEMVKNVRVFDSLSEYVGFREGRAPVVIAASGNSSDRESETPSIIGTSFPAAAKGFFSVSAVRRPDKKSQQFPVTSFANSGALLAGPGQDILSAAFGNDTAGERLTYLDGTSMAAPHVAGIAALWAQKLLESGPQQLNDRIGVKLKEKSHPVAKSKKSSTVDYDVLYGIPRAPLTTD